ncbi:cation transporter [Nakamurella endophytica]|uniref:Cation efflux protein transmembrane domain-containing protein n=1 Tax=Nakamurella endophytica TaxID=1748367 RepID=A0A917WK38_9ACTN|nr:cation transporter [Nakamurella endophytica]GGM09347.1 hypothetical protein GCM10011594_31530 [Nakamurella endophytica]
MTESVAGARLARPARIAIGLLWATIAYNVLEGVVAVWAGLAAGLVSLTGFGVDSGIEVAAAGIVLLRLRAEVRHGKVDETKERRALRAVAVTFFLLAAYVTVEGVRDLINGVEPGTSVVGIVLTALSVLIMPMLARYKRINGERLGNRLVLADAAETKLCSWLSVSTLTGLVLFAVAGWTWVDSVAGFIIAYFAVREGREAWEGELVCDDGCDDD